MTNWNVERNSNERQNYRNVPAIADSSIILAAAVCDFCGACHIRCSHFQTSQASHRTLQRLHYTATPCQDCIGLTFSSSVVDFNQLPRCETRHLAFRARARDIWRENTFRREVVFLVSNYCALLPSRKWLRCFASERSSVNSPRIETHIIQFINS